MRAWQPLLVQKIEIHALDFVLRKLQLNRHRDSEVATHAHDHAQLILYLSGEGIQSIQGRRRPARAGDLFVIPANTPHGFSVVGRSRPLCLVLDYMLERSGRVRAAYRRLAPASLSELHGALSRVPRKGRLVLADYPAILAVVARLLTPTRAKAPNAPTLFETVRRQLGAERSMAKISRALGYHPDHLTRKLKNESGLGLRALRDRLRLAQSQSGLRQFSTVAEAASAAGFEDPNYFARWFRQQTGLTPRAWRLS